MKNIHLLPTDKPSRVFITKDEGLGFDNQMLGNTELDCQNQNISITNDEEIKEGDYVLSDTSVGALYLDGEINTASMLAEGQWKKVILTTDQDLIKDGVQAINDEFLQWFVNNSSCKFVEIKMENYYASGALQPNLWEYKIIIPKEEPKQETLEQIDQTNPVTRGSTALVSKQETLEEAYNKIYKEIDFSEFDFASFAIGAKWQQEQDKDKLELAEHLYTVVYKEKEISYSEEEVLDILEKRDLHMIINLGGNNTLIHRDKWFEQFKKKYKI